MKRAFIIHGWGGTADSGWKGWLKSELAARGFEVHSPQMPDSENPKMDEWLSLLSKLVGKPDGETYLVGHSLGCITILRYLEGLKKGEQVGGVVLVAGFSDDLGIGEIAGFFPKPFDFGKIKTHCKNFVAIHSTNDKYVALKYGDIFQKELGAALIVLENMGHFSHSEGIVKLPAALASVLKISRK